MIQRTEGRQRQFQFLLSVVVLTATGLAGCRDTDEDRSREQESYLAMKLLEKPPEDAGPGVSERVEGARLRLRNGILDREPIPIGVDLFLPRQ